MSQVVDLEQKRKERFMNSESPRELTTEEIIKFVETSPNSLQADQGTDDMKVITGAMVIFLDENDCMRVCFEGITAGRMSWVSAQLQAMMLEAFMEN